MANKIPCEYPEICGRSWHHSLDHCAGRAAAMMRAGAGSITPSALPPDDDDDDYDSDTFQYQGEGLGERVPESVVQRNARAAIIGIEHQSATTLTDDAKKNATDSLRAMMTAGTSPEAWGKTYSYRPKPFDDDIVRHARANPVRVARLMSEIPHASNYLDKRSGADALVNVAAVMGYEQAQDEWINEGNDPEKLVSHGQVMTRDDSDEFVGDNFEQIRVHLPENLREDQRERAEELVSYAARQSHRGENLGTHSHGRIVGLGHDSTKANTSRWHGDDFTEALEKGLDEGSPMRTTDRSGPGTKGTRAVEGLGMRAEDKIVVYYGQ